LNHDIWKINQQKDNLCFSADFFLSNHHFSLKKIKLLGKNRNKKRQHLLKEIKLKNNYKTMH